MLLKYNRCFIKPNKFQDQVGGAPAQPKAFDIDRHVTISENYNQYVKLYRTTGLACTVQ
jgi:hypothetical protein